MSVGDRHAKNARKHRRLHSPRHLSGPDTSSLDAAARTFLGPSELGAIRRTSARRATQRATPKHEFPSLTGANWR